MQVQKLKKKTKQVIQKFTSLKYHKQVMIERQGVCLRYDQKKAYFNKFRAI